MISTQKSRNKLLLPELFFFDNLTTATRGKIQTLKQENTKNPKINITFLPLFHCFPITQTQIEHKPNINLILKKKKETQNSQRVLNNRRERTLRMRMDDVVKVDEMKRERGTVG